jgi:hypothetical protein
MTCKISLLFFYSYFLTSDNDCTAPNASKDDFSICDSVTGSNADINKSKECSREPDPINFVQQNRSFDSDDSNEDSDYSSSSCSDSEISLNEAPMSFKVKAMVHSQPEPYPSSYDDSVEAVEEIITISSDSEVSEINSDLAQVKTKCWDKNDEVWNKFDNNSQERPKVAAGLLDNTDAEEFSRLQLSLSDLDEDSFTEIKQMSTSMEAETAAAKGLNGKKFLPKKKSINGGEIKHSVIELSDER